jgi:hypothetical protein
MRREELKYEKQSDKPREPIKGTIAVIATDPLD